MKKSEWVIFYSALLHTIIVLYPNNPL